MLNINRINSVSIKNGTHVGLGLGIGALAGLAVGILIVSNSNDEQTDPLASLILEPVNTGANFLWGLLSTLSGALVGMIVGGNINAYDTFYMQKISFDKKSELERILRIDYNKNVLKK